MQIHGAESLLQPTMVEALNGALVTALHDPENCKRLTQLGADPVDSSIEERDACIKTEIARWIQVSRTGIDPQ